MLVAVTAHAQQQDVRDLLDRIERLERDLNILQSQFYRSQSGNASGGATTATAPPAGSGGGPVSSEVYNTLDQRISALEDQMRTMTGQIEKVSHDADEINSRLDRMQADNDVRFKELEQKGGAPAAAGAAPAAPPAAAQGGAPQPSVGAGASQSTANAGTSPGAGQDNAAWNPTMGSPPHNLGQISDSDLKKLGPKNADAATAPPPPAESGNKTPQEQYDAVFALLRNNDLDGATKAFQDFLAKYPKDPLAGNATYWLGQIAFSQGKYEQAAPIFFDAYRKYPKSAKAGESLLKVGLAMSKLGNKREACAALARFTTEFPDAADGLKRQATTEKQKLVCGG